MEAYKPPEENLFYDILQYLVDSTNSELGFINFTVKDNHQAPLMADNHTFYAITRHRQLNRYPISRFQPHQIEALRDYIVQTNKIIISNAPKQDPNLCPIMEARTHLQSLMCIPLSNAESIAGILTITNAPNGYTHVLANQIEPLINTLSNLIELNYSSATNRPIQNLDRFTQVYDQTYFEAQLKEVIAYHKKYHKKFCMIMIEIYPTQMKMRSWGPNLLRDWGMAVR